MESFMINGPSVASGGKVPLSPLDSGWQLRKTEHHLSCLSVYRHLPFILTFPEASLRLGVALLISSPAVYW